MPEWRKIFEVGDSYFGVGSGHHGSVSSNEIGAPNASHLGTRDHAAEPTEADQDQSQLTRFPEATERITCKAVPEFCCLSLLEGHCVDCSQN